MVGDLSILRSVCRFFFKCLFFAGALMILFFRRIYSVPLVVIFLVLYCWFDEWSFDCGPYSPDMDTSGT